MPFPANPALLPLLLCICLLRPIPSSTTVRAWEEESIGCGRTITSEQREEDEELVLMRRLVCGNLTGPEEVRKEDGKERAGTGHWAEYFERDSKAGIVTWLLAVILLVLILVALIVLFLRYKASVDQGMDGTQQGRQSRRRDTLHVLPKESITI